jgi:hypothetical protein
MVDAVDPLLNDAVDLYIQAVDYRRIPTSQISTPVGTITRLWLYCARFWQLAITAGSLAMWLGSWTDPAVMARYRQNLAVMAGSWSGSIQDGRLSAN